jgi:hypothetical protein
MLFSLTKLFFTLFFFVLSFVLSSFPVNACAWDSTYQRCTGSCLCGNCGPNACQLIAPETCGCIANTPQPTNTPAGGRASSTPRPPTATPAPCSSTNDCVGYCAGIPNCSAACINGYCVFTNPTINNSQCNTWGNWSGCISGQGACGGCAAQGYTCQTRSCTNPSNANLYQISCGCSQPPGGGSANPTDTSAPIPNPSSVCDPFSPKKKKFLHLCVFVS